MYWLCQTGVSSYPCVVRYRNCWCTADLQITSKSVHLAGAARGEGRAAESERASADADGSTEQQGGGSTHPQRARCALAHGSATPAHPRAGGTHHRLDEPDERCAENGECWPSATSCQPLLLKLEATPFLAKITCQEIDLN